jgi:hypothetical protein
MLIMSENLWPFKVVFSFGNSQKSVFGQKLLDSKHIMSRGIVMMQDPSIRPKFRSSPMNSLM